MKGVGLFALFVLVEWTIMLSGYIPELTNGVLPSWMTDVILSVVLISTLIALCAISWFAADPPNRPK